MLGRRSLLLPTFRGWVVLGLGFVLIFTCFVKGIHPFLALNDDLSDGLLVVEGWTPDYGLAAAIEIFKRDQYQKIYVTGGPLEHGTYLVGYKNYAELGAATLIREGLDSNVVQAVPAPLVRQDRTYTAAVSLKKWLLEHGIQPTRLHLLSEGCHGRRSRLLFQKAMGKGVTVGVTSIPSAEYDAQHWWRYSAGVRSVIDETVAYLYAKLLFSPPHQSG